MKMKIVFFLIFILTQHLLLAQSKSSDYHFVVQGKVLHSKESSWNFSKTNFLDYENVKVPISSDGTFKMQVPIEGMQDLYLNLNVDRSITIYAQPNDTINISWDEKDIYKTLAIGSPNRMRNLDLELNLKLYRHSMNSTLPSPREIFEAAGKVADSVRFRWINDAFNRELSVVFGDSYLTGTTEKFLKQIYFKHAKLLLDNWLHQKYRLTPEFIGVKPEYLESYKMQMPNSMATQTLDATSFYQSPEYRSFICNYLLDNKPFNITAGHRVYKFNSVKVDSFLNVQPFQQTKFYDGIDEDVETRIVWNNHYLGSTFNIPAIRDWYCTKVIIDGFSHYSFDEIESVLKDFLPKCRTQVYKDTLESFYKYVKRFRKGSPAPNFTLTDENGKAVSLSDFRGKFVYIDFWNVGCAPCRYHIQNYAPMLHEKYQGKDVVFVNICVEDLKNDWKDALLKLKPKGVNLLAEGWTKNKTEKDYNLSSFPHYILIDRNGNFADYNAPDPRELLMTDEPNVLDKLLKGENL